MCYCGCFYEHHDGEGCRRPRDMACIQEEDFDPEEYVLEKADRAYRDLQDPSLCHKNYDYPFA